MYFYSFTNDCSRCWKLNGENISPKIWIFLLDSPSIFSSYNTFLRIFVHVCVSQIVSGFCLRWERSAAWIAKNNKQLVINSDLFFESNTFIDSVFSMVFVSLLKTCSTSFSEKWILKFKLHSLKFIIQFISDPLSLS